MADTPAHFQLYKDAKGEWRWTLYARNMKKIADSAESYKNKADCSHGIDLVVGATPGSGIWNADTKAWERNPK